MPQKMSYQPGESYTSLSKFNQNEKIVKSFKKGWEDIPAKVKTLILAFNNSKNDYLGVNRKLVEQANVSKICGELYQHLQDLRGDFQAKKVSQEKYAAYLDIYRKLIDSQIPPDGDALYEFGILAEINKYSNEDSVPVTPVLQKSTDVATTINGITKAAPFDKLSLQDARLAESAKEIQRIAREFADSVKPESR